MEMSTLTIASGAAAPVGAVSGQVKGNPVAQPGAFASVLVHVMGSAGQNGAQPDAPVMHVTAEGGVPVLPLVDWLGEGESLLEQLKALLNSLASGEHAQFPEEELRQLVAQLEQLLAQGMGTLPQEGVSSFDHANAQQPVEGNGSGVHALIRSLKSLLSDLKLLQELHVYRALTSDIGMAAQSAAGRMESLIRSWQEALLQAKVPVEPGTGSPSPDGEASPGGARMTVAVAALQSAVWSKSAPASMIRPDAHRSASPVMVLTEEGSFRNIQSAVLSVRPMPVHAFSAMQHAASHSGDSSGDGMEAAQTSMIPEAQSSMLQNTAAQSRLHQEVPAPKGEPAPVPVYRFAAEMGDWMVKQLRLSSSGGVSEARLTLHPEHLGQVQVKLTMQNGQLVAQFLADTVAGKEAIESQLSQLRMTLQNQGIQVEKLEVSHSAAASGQSQFQEQRDQQFSRPQHEGGKERAERLDKAIAEFSEMLEDLPHALHGLYGSSFEATA